ncbi:maleylpyruvate isomerase N-terminal domain-containing protein [Blastococcus sp. CT_GayMR20]|uniref:maleylpyruvate isomerase N-terminal domain-containing protein n=1 Tax=Blastococcus sp. CT_GayMR20 TaxID=2559609 RepID=UPI001ADDBF2C|nr:maleylpyruvate isomerase N-terminal domain-containing protein [Blastococcus sp. CT_GayMR20]
MPDPVSLLRPTYGDVSAVLSSLTVAEGWEPTGCAGWTPVDLGFHLLSDARRALVTLHTPADGPADTTAVDYWTAWRPPEPGDDEELWSTRIAASVHGGLTGIAGRYAETSAAAVVAAGRSDPEAFVHTQGRVLTVADFLSTLVVEAAVHHLDLVLRLDRPGPAAGPLPDAPPDGNR